MPSTTPTWSGATAPGRERTGRRSRRLCNAPPSMALDVVALVDLAQQPRDLGLVALDLVQALTALRSRSTRRSISSWRRQAAMSACMWRSSFRIERWVSASMPTKTPADSRASAAGDPCDKWSTSAPIKPASAATIRPLSSQWRAPRFSRPAASTAARQPCTAAPWEGRRSRRRGRAGNPSRAGRSRSAARNRRAAGSKREGRRACREDGKSCRKRKAAPTVSGKPPSPKQLATRATLVLDAHE